jgi:hypothetical protein
MRPAILLVALIAAEASTFNALIGKNLKWDNWCVIQAKTPSVDLHYHPNHYIDKTPNSIPSFL